MSDEPPRPVRPAGPTRPAVVVLIVGIVVFVLAAAAVVGYVVLGRGGSGGAFDTAPSTVTVTSTPDSTPIGPTSVEPSTTSSAPSRSTTTSSRPTTSRPTASGPTVAGAPAGSTACPVEFGPYYLYRASSVGSPVTTCGFAERVRRAYGESGRPGQLPRPVVATSPETGERIRMMCAAEARIVTCTGGDDAVVYLY
ncbi:hypothetical protein [Williamsia deligens]|uniref:Serine/threonine protein kinase n=1 Tax=Williamsia deligens TaxID=321325 RepID=A0ABW3G7V2_9NOCA|nr:hypothetical protein [Williamsia deligens]MCP2192444.1 hypothetical protein [Williamsia deligens]